MRMYKVSGMERPKNWSAASGKVHYSAETVEKSNGRGIS